MSDGDRSPYEAGYDAGAARAALLADEALETALNRARRALVWRDGLGRFGGDVADDGAVPGLDASLDRLRGEIDAMARALGERLVAA